MTNIIMTVKAYSSGLEDFHQFSGFLASLEGEVASQQATSTLLSVLASLQMASTGHFATSGELVQGSKDPIRPI